MFHSVTINVVTHIKLLKSSFISLKLYHKIPIRIIANFIILFLPVVRFIMFFFLIIHQKGAEMDTTIDQSVKTIPYSNFVTVVARKFHLGPTLRFRKLFKALE